MKKKTAILCLIFFILGLSAVLLAKTEKLTGKDWSTLTRQRKEYYVFGQMEAFQEKGMIFSVTPAKYIELLDKKVVREAHPEGMGMDEIFRAVVRENEASGGGAIGLTSANNQ